MKLVFCLYVSKEYNTITVAKSCPTATPWTAAYQASLSITISRSLLKLTSTESVMPSNHLSLCCPLLLLPSIFPNIRVFSNESVILTTSSALWMKTSAQQKKKKKRKGQQGGITLLLRKHILISQTRALTPSFEKCYWRAHSLYGSDCFDVNAIHSMP